MPNAICTTHRVWLTVKYLTILTVYIGIFVGFFFFFSSNAFEDLTFWVEKHQIIGLLVFFCLFTLASFPLVPAYGIICMVSGVIWGLLFGTLISAIMSIIGAGIGFFACRYLLHDWTWRQIKQSERLTFIVEALVKYKWKMAFLMRLAPIPCGIVNAVMGVSGVSFIHFMIGSFLPMIFDAFMFVLIGVQARDIALIVKGKIKRKWWEWLIVALQFAVIFGILVILFFVVKRQLSKYKKAKLLEVEPDEEDAKPLITSRNDEDDTVHDKLLN